MCLSLEREAKDFERKPCLCEATCALHASGSSDAFGPWEKDVLRQLAVWNVLKPWFGGRKQGLIDA